MSGDLPRYFVARSGQEQTPADSSAPIMQFIDSFIVGGRHLCESDCVVGVDALGDLQLCSMASARQAEQDLQGQLTFSELSNSGGRQLLALSRFHLFAMQVMEQPGDSPGFNDPIYLYGKLFGTFPEAPNTVAAEGQLTVTRADILYGLLSSERYCFTYAAGTNHSSLPTRCLHFIVPGDIDSELQRGAGVIIVYPLPTAELAASDPSNEVTIKQIIFDIVSALKKDLEKEGLKSKVSKLDLPVPSRRMLEMNLESRGYSIKGDTAVRKLPITGPFDGFLESLYGKLSGEKLNLPPEGTLGDFFEIANIAVQSIKGWPPERCKLISRLSRTASPEEIARATQSNAPMRVREIRTPRASSLHESQTKPSNKGQESSKSSNREASTAQDWMKDFMSSHKPGISTTSNIKPEQKQEGSKKTQKSAPDWMNDFKNKSDMKPDEKDKIKQHKTKADESEPKPDWMGDFQ